MSCVLITSVETREAIEVTGKSNVSISMSTATYNTTHDSMAKDTHLLPDYIVALPLSLPKPIPDHMLGLELTPAKATWP